MQIHTMMQLLLLIQSLYKTEGVFSKSASAIKASDVQMGTGSSSQAHDMNLRISVIFWDAVCTAQDS